MSKLSRSILIAIAISTVAISPAWADPHGYRGGRPGQVHRGGHGTGGWGALGLALFGTAVYLAATAPPAPYQPAPVYVQPTYVQPPVVITQPPPPPAPVSEQNWWYYCAQPAGYYPYIKACPAGWTRVSPVPPAQ